MTATAQQPAPTELKPLKQCPFCGCDNIVTNPVMASIPDQHYGQCLSCGTCGPWRDTQPETVAAWNARADDAKVSRLVAAVRELVAKVGETAASGDCGKWLDGYTDATKLALTDFPAEDRQ